MSQVEHARGHNRIYIENKFGKQDTDWQNSLAIRDDILQYKPETLSIVDFVVKMWI